MIIRTKSPGLVLIDVQDLPASDGAAPKPAPKPGRNSLPALLARVGLVRLLAGPLGAIQNLPPVEKQAYYASAVTPLYAQTFLDEGMGMSEGGAQARDVTTLGATAHNRSFTRQRSGRQTHCRASCPPPVNDEQPAALCRKKWS
jgi:hypothetical protein